MKHLTTRKRTLAYGGVLGAAALAGGATGTFALTAGGGNQPVTSNPDLVSAKVVRGYSSGVTTARLQACYDTQVATIAAAKYVITGYDAGTTKTATAAVLDPTDQKCVLVDFAQPTDLGSATVLTDTGGGATTLVGSLASTAGSAALEGGTLSKGIGLTAGPDLVGTPTVNTTDKTITFTFDAPLSPTPADTDASRIKAYTSTGTTLTAASAVASGSTITATFAEALSGATAPVRFALLEDAVTAIDGLTNNTQSAGSATTALPRLSAAVPVGANQIQLTYDRAINTGTFVPGSITAYAEDARSGYDATSIANITSTTVLVTFGGAQDFTRFTDKITGVADTGGAAELQGDATLKSPASFIGLRTANIAPGFTDGPDLVQVVLNSATNSATYTFDENLDEGFAATPANFVLLDANGTVSAASSASVSGKTVTAQFTATQLGAAKAAQALAGAVQDNEKGADDRNPLNSVALGTAGTTTATTTTTTTVTTPTTTTTTTPTTTATTPTTPTTTGTTPTTTTPTTPTTTKVSATRVSATARRTGNSVRVTGAISIPSSRSKSTYCGRKGTITVTAKVGTRTVATKRATLQKTCRYSATITLSSAVKKKIGTKAKRLTLKTRFGGNTLIRPRNAATTTVSLPKR